MPFDPEILERFPEEPGVYLMKAKDKQVIYVGKAKSLKQRVKQYFSPGRDSRPIIPFLLMELDHIETILVENEKEALLVENTLIKKHQPKYNALLKDDKSFISLMINHQHKWPRIRLIRYKGKPKEKGLYFGPYTSAYAARQTYELLTKLFPLRQCSNEELERRTRPCLLYGIKRCIAPCVGLCQKEEYDTFVEGVIKFLKGKDQEIMEKLYREMEEASEKLQFERAGALLHTIRQMEHVIKTRQIVQKTAHRNSDCLGCYRRGDEVIIMQLFIREGQLTGSEHYSFTNALEEDLELIESFLLQYYQKAQDLPQEILLPFPIKNSASIEEILYETHKKTLTLHAPKKGSKKALILLAEKNAKATFELEKDDHDIREKMLLDLSETLGLNRYPRRIECFDTSNISGTDLVASMIAFTDGLYDKKRTRLYKIHNIHKGDDYASLHQVLTRRLLRAKEEDDLPDLILIDGGKGQLNKGLQVFKELDIANVDLAAISKEESKHTKGMTQEKVHVQERKDPILLHPRSPVLLLLQQIRDAAHEKALGFHRKRREKRLIASSLQHIPGIGPIKTKRLLKHFGSLQRICNASEEELAKIKSITKKDVATLKKALTDFKP